MYIAHILIAFGCWIMMWYVMQKRLVIGLPADFMAALWFSAGVLLLWKTVADMFTDRKSKRKAVDEMSGEELQDDE